ncbi:hypothetical protein D6856_14350 [Butyrivibrio sp. XB500-5]|uniref:hypothetical protein n=1 Tax=Butyrivibrio sp. XB500-5 TaxID=2364880 RepID=UPI000EA84748|nr:hypothetical protein [Butyrivibrio sp. XB500-5]RKM56954.1 hypothetical protein D6856_14350 [Butyrivibrio sp. XB500-5]
MRRKEFISKKLAVVLMSAIMLIAPIVGSIAAPIDAHAEMDELVILRDADKTPVEDNNNLEEAVEELPDGVIMENNNGVITTNEGTVTHNTENAGVYQNNGEIRYNEGIVAYNEGEINNNTGRVNVNKEHHVIYKNDGLVDNNSNAAIFNGQGTVDHNWWGGVVIGSPGVLCDTEAGEGPYLGTININNGDILNGVGADDVLTVNTFVQGTIDTALDNYDPNETRGISVYRLVEYPRLGKVHIIDNLDENEFKENDLILVDNQYHAVSLMDTDNATVEYNNFADLPIDMHMVQTGINKTDIPITGTITLRPNSGYKITDNGQLSGEVETLSYNLNKNNDGSYTIGIASLKGNVMLTADMLNLIVSELTAEEAANIQQLVVGDTVVNLDDIKDGDAIVIEGSNHSSSDNSGSPVEAAAPAGYNLADEAIKAVTDQVQKQVAASGNDIAALEVIDIYFGDKIDMSPAVIEYLCEKVPVAKRCHFDYKDQEYVMFIPAFDLVAPAYAEGLEVLNNEPAHTAGFLRITQIFEKLGFATKVVEEQEAAE